MLLETILGILAGVFTGLIPGVHVNLVAVLVLSLGFGNPISFGCFIVALAVTHTFLDVIPSVFLGVPTEDMIVAMLPGHKLLHEGKGYEAIRLATIGSLGSLIAALMLFPLLIVIVPLLYDLIQPYIGWILLIVTGFLIMRDGKPLIALCLFLVSGLLGYVVLDMAMDQPLLPMLSGLFGVSSLILSLQDVGSVSLQDTEASIIVEKKDLFRCISAATLSGWITSMFPGLGSAQAAILSSVIFRDLGSHLYLIVVGGINTVNFTLSIVTFYTLGKARNGAIVAITELIKAIDLYQVSLFCSVALFAGGIATLLAVGIGKVAAVWIDRVPYEKITVAVISLVVLLVYYFSGTIGLMVLLVSSALGMLAPLLGVARIHLMGCLLVNVLLYLL